MIWWTLDVLMMLPPPPRLDEMRERVPRAEHGAGQIDVENAAIGLDVERLARRLPLETGIVDETIEARPTREHRLEHLCDIGLDADIGVNDEMVPSLMPPLGRRRLHAASVSSAAAGGPTKLIATLAPSWAKRTAIARPMPWEAPVTSA